MSEDTIWFIDKEKVDCPACRSVKTVRIEYYNAVRFPLESTNEFVTHNLVKKKTKKICESCNHIEESWEEWKETRYPKGYELDFLRRRALYFKDHVPAMCSEAFNDFFKIKPSDHEMRYEHGQFLIKRGNLYEAYSELQKSLQKKKDYLPAIEAINDLLYTLFASQNEVWYEKRIYFKQFVRIFSNFQDLRKELNNNLRYLLEYHKKNPDKLILYYIQAGNLMEDFRQFSLAMQYYEYVFNQSTQNTEKSESCIRMAIVSANLQDYEKAFDYLEKSYSIVPNALIYFYRTKIYYKCGNNELAGKELALYLKEIDKIIDKDPKNPKLYYLKGLGLELLESTDYLIKYYDDITNNLSIDIDYRKIFYDKINNLKDPELESVVEDGSIPCPVCKFHKVKVYKSRDSVAGLHNWADGINSTVYYLRSIRKICLKCRYQWTDYFNWDEREWEYPG